MIVQLLCGRDGIDKHDFGEAVAELMGQSSTLAEGRNDFHTRVCPVCDHGQQGDGVKGIAGDVKLAIRQDAGEGGHRTKVDSVREKMGSKMMAGRI